MSEVTKSSYATDQMYAHYMERRSLLLDRNAARATYDASLIFTVDGVLFNALDVVRVGRVKVAAGYLAVDMHGTPVVLNNDIHKQAVSVFTKAALAYTEAVKSLTLTSDTNNAD